jgi:hypothetical protein
MFSGKEWRYHVVPMPHLAWVVIAASGLLFGQMQNFGTPPPDPEEKKRAEKVIAQGDKMLAHTSEQVKLNREQVRLGWIAIGIAAIALVVSLVALFRTH